MSNSRRMAIGILCASVALALVGCEGGGDGDGGGDPSTPITGQWEIVVNTEGSLTLTNMRLVNVSITETNGQLSGSVTGTHNGQDVAFTVIGSGITYTCSGTYDGNSMSGTCEVTGTGMTAGLSGSGTFTASRQ